MLAGNPASGVLLGHSTGRFTWVRAVIFNAVMVTSGATFVLVARILYIKRKGTGHQFANFHGVGECDKMFISGQKSGVTGAKGWRLAWPLCGAPFAVIDVASNKGRLEQKQASVHSRPVAEEASATIPVGEVRVDGLTRSTTWLDTTPPSPHRVRLRGCV
ncbi:hypothetical protein C8J57DRAFT_1252752 [Mycena rebaudengoi]|nr:hypothetical protein C8J57DRAFT_1252752 [Mycena rebaudengoi]